MTEVLAQHIADGKKIIQQTLHTMTPTQIRDGLGAFEHAPNGTMVGCFVTCADMWDDYTLGVAWLSWSYETSPQNVGRGWTENSKLYGDLNTWLKGECVRELAERGAAPEAAPQQEEAICSATIL